MLNHLNEYKQYPKSMTIHLKFKLRFTYTGVNQALNSP